MIRYALLLCAGLLAALCFACVQQQPPLTARSGMQLRGCTSGTPGSGASFAAAVQFLNGFDPGNPRQAPSGATGLPGKPNYAQALQNAFMLAPPKVQAQLCGLDGVYVNGGACPATDPSCFAHAWGYRAFSDKKWYIAIPAGLWSRAQPYPYHQYESDLLQEVYGWDPSWATPPAPAYIGAKADGTGTNSEADNFDMTILAALAHELGHVYWYQAMHAANPGDDYKPNEFCKADGSTFFSSSWAGKVNKAPQWRKFAELAPDQHLLDPQISDIDNSLNAGEVNPANAALDQLYQSTPISYPWASYFAALSPDEDFVETYKFYVLINAQSGQIANEGPLRSLPLRISYVGGTYSTENIPADYFANKKPALWAKVNCIAQSM